MKRLLIILTVVTLAGCSTIGEYIPSRWDVNQAKVTTDLRQSTKNFNCAGDVKAQLKTIHDQIEWFDLYAESKGTKDVAKLTATMTKTVKEFQERADKGPVSPLYCKIKQGIMSDQAGIIAHAVQGRF
jgi:uncharacterized protein YceK